MVSTNIQRAMADAPRPHLRHSATKKGKSKLKELWPTSKMSWSGFMDVDGATSSSESLPTDSGTLTDVKRRKWSRSRNASRNGFPCAISSGDMPCTAHRSLAPRLPGFTTIEKDAPLPPIRVPISTMLPDLRFYCIGDWHARFSQRADSALRFKLRHPCCSDPHLSARQDV